MKRVLFVTNGHGEAAIAARIAEEVRALEPVRTEHFPLVGEDFRAPGFPDVGPRRTMPSGGLVAMGNVRAFGRDLAAGWAGLFVRQLVWLSRAAARRPLVVAVGDAYACLLALRAHRPLIYVGTAKSEYVAPYGALERRIIGAASRIFVRDAATAAALRARGVAAEAPGNVIVDLLATAERYAWPGAVRLALLPGSRERAYVDAERLCAVASGVAAQVPDVAIALSIAPALDPARFRPILARHPAVVPWTGPVGGILTGATLALGQAGTANEAAAANGVPVVAFDIAGDRRSGWYRMRQERLLGEALAVVPGDPARAIGAVTALVNDPARRERMAQAGRQRMGPPGGARAIAGAIALALAGCTGAPPSQGTPPPALTPTPVPVHVLSSGNGGVTTMTEMKRGKVIYRVRARSFTVDTAGGSNAAGTGSFDQPQITFVDRSGAQTVANAPKAELSGADKSVVMTGGVRARSQDGNVLHCDRLRYDGRSERLHGDGHVRLETPSGFVLTGDRLDGDARLADVRVVRDR